MNVGVIAAVVAPLARLRSKTSADAEFYDPERAHDGSRISSRRPTPNLHLTSSGGVDTSQPLHSSSYGSIFFETPDGEARIHSSPERLRRDSTAGILNCVPEDGAMNFDNNDGPAYINGAPLNEEEEELELDEELAEQGLHRGSYEWLIALYTLVPLTSAVVFAFLAFLPTIAYPIDQTSPYTYAPYFPFPLPELLTSLALWSFAYLLCDPLYTFASVASAPFPSVSPALPIILSTTLQTIISLFFRVIAVPILLIPQFMLCPYPTWQDPAFRRVWWVAIGWAAAEAVVGIRQGYGSIALYRDVLVTCRRVNGGDVLDHPGKPNGPPENGTDWASSRNGSPHGVAGSSRAEYTDTSRRGSYDESDPGRLDGGGEREMLLPRQPPDGWQEFQSGSALQVQVDHDLDQLIALKNRAELEEVYGMPVIRIPVFISCLHRINSAILALGICLLLSSAYTHSTFAVFSPEPLPSNLLSMSSSSKPPCPFDGPVSKSNTYLFITLPIILVLHLFLNLLHTPLILPRIGVHTAVYIGLLVSLGSFFAGLGVWEALS